MKLIALALSMAVAGANAADFEKVSVRREGDLYRVQATATVNAGFDAVRAVITDYKHMHWITGAVLKSRVLDHPEPGIAVIAVRSRACFGIFCKTIEQVQFADAREARQVVFVSIPAWSDVKQARSKWFLTVLDEGRTQVDWDMSMEPDFWVPPFIGPGLIESGLSGEGRDMINGIEKLAREREAQK